MISPRFGLAALILLCILGGTALFTGRKAPSVSSVPQRVMEISGDYALEVTATFRPQPDPFALDAGGRPAPPVRVSLSGSDVFLENDFTPDVPLRVPLTQGLTAGVNIFYLEASPPLGEYQMSHAVRLRVLHGNLAIAEDTFWADHGAAIRGNLHVRISGERTP